MKQLTILITPEGQWVLPETPEFFAALGDPNPDYDAIGFAVKNLGFIKFQVIQQSIVEIELHPRNVELAALLAVQQQLLTSDVRLFRIKYFDTTWQSEIASSAEFTIQRLSELCAPQFTPPKHERFLVEPQDFGMLFQDEPNNLRAMAQKWRVSFAHFDPRSSPWRCATTCCRGWPYRRQAARAGPGVALYRRRAPLARRRQVPAHRARREGRQHSRQGLRRMGERLLPRSRRIRAAAL